MSEKIFAERRRVVDARRLGKREGYLTGMRNGIFIGIVGGIALMVLASELITWLGRS